MRIGTVNQIWRYAVKSMAGERLESCTVETMGIPADRGWAVRDETTGETTNGKHMPLLMQTEARYLEPPSDGSIPHVVMRFPNGVELASDAGDVNERLSELLGKRVSLWPRQPATDLEFYRRKSKMARAFAKLARVRAFRAAIPVFTSFGKANAELREAFSREPGEPIPDLSNLPAEIFEFTSPLGTYFDAFPIHLLTTSSIEAMRKLNPAATWDARRFRPNFLIETDVEGLIESNWGGKTLRVGNVELRCEIPCVRCGMTIQAQKEFPKDPSILRSIVKDANQNFGVYANVTKPGEIRVGDTVELD
ncbi:MAG TPA: MOSC N-terminal beta barrel domain-containing protein [Pyrinomonadaceae bacterium]|nr:MOSC N-terminal beta barrel domain-containing protein [Pyrinomonadaceae bacterium]